MQVSLNSTGVGSQNPRPKVLGSVPRIFFFGQMTYFCRLTMRPKCVTGVAEQHIKIWLDVILGFLFMTPQRLGKFSYFASSSLTLTQVCCSLQIPNQPVEVQVSHNSTGVGAETQTPKVLASIPGIFFLCRSDDIYFCHLTMGPICVTGAAEQHIKIWLDVIFGRLYRDQRQPLSGQRGRRLGRDPPVETSTAHRSALR